MKYFKKALISALFSMLATLPISKVFAGLKAPDFTLSSRLQASTWIVTATSPDLHHFNIQAPMSLGIDSTADGGSDGDQIKPNSATEKSVVFKISETDVKAGKKFRVTLYLCDDAKTFCEKHQLDYVISGQSGKTSATSPVVEKARPASVRPAQSPVKTDNSHGYYLNLPEQALAKAKRDGKPLMIDFFGIWCPPCNELDEKVFSTQKFLQSASRFVRLNLDADAQVSWDLKSQYQIGGYPTIVFATPEGDEISRIVGSRPLKEFLGEMDGAWNNRLEPLAALEKKASAGDREAADRAGIIRLNRGDAVIAAKWLKGSQKEVESWHLAEIQVLEDSNAPGDEQIVRLNEAVKAFPKTPHTVEWFEKLAKLYGQQKDGEKRKSALTQAIGLALELSKNPEALKGYDATSADLLEGEAEDREELDGSPAAHDDWLAAARAYALQGIGEKERANNLEYAFCLGKAGELRKARAIYGRLEKAYPNEFTFYFAHARMESDHQRFAQALSLAKQALVHSYGDNHLRAVLLVAKIHESLGEKDKSRAILDKTLKDLELPADEKVRTHRFAKAIREMRAKLD